MLLKTGEADDSFESYVSLKIMPIKNQYFETLFESRLLDFFIVYFDKFYFSILFNKKVTDTGNNDTMKKLCCFEHEK